MTDKPEDKPIEQTGRILRAEIRTKATPQQAYEAWADPEKIAHWFPDRAEARPSQARQSPGSSTGLITAFPMRC